MISAPAATTFPCPMRLASFPAGAATNAAANGPGEPAIPESEGLYPQTTCSH